MWRLMEAMEGNFGLEAVTKRPLIDVTPNRIAIIEKLNVENVIVMRIDLLDRVDSHLCLRILKN